MSLQKIAVLMLATVSANPATGWDCEAYHEYWCPVWEFGDECYTGDTMPIKKFKCERWGGWGHGYWNFKGEVRDNQFKACPKSTCDRMSSIPTCKDAGMTCDVCSCVKGYVATCTSFGGDNVGECKHTNSRLSAGRRRVGIEEILGVPAAHLAMRDEVA